jgi:site-specific DNA recombinase
MSIDAQRRELQALAARLNLIILNEFSDAVESGKDTNRPGFQALFADMISAHRAWNKILVLDTARLSRRRVNAIVFEEIEAKRRGVLIIYKSLPDSDPITDMLLKSILQAMDEWHSLTSKQKGLAGMAENVRQGYRAGGRAPFGYALDKVTTGAIRDGEPVTKSKLKPNDDAPAIQRYLVARAAGTARALAKADVDLPDTTLIGIEWNALTYSGNTVWNVHNERTEDGYVTGAKRRPRAEWVIQNGTHEALITEDQAEAILSTLMKKKKERQTPSSYLLTGILMSPDDQAWHGDGTGTYYRLGKGRKVRCDNLDEAVLRKLGSDLSSSEFISAITKRVKESLKQVADGDIDEKLLRDDFKLNNKKIDTLTAMLTETTAHAALLRQIEKLEADRERIVARLEATERIAAQAKIVNLLSERDVRESVQHAVESLDTLDRHALKDFLGKLVDAVILSPTDLTCSIRYRISLSRGDKLASPRGFDLIPPILIERMLRLAA